ncbi:MAG: hypothetical protein AB1403_20480, partial [Candidatus Riflebacteria bacterium]
MNFQARRNLSFLIPVFMWLLPLLVLVFVSHEAGMLRQKDRQAESRDACERLSFALRQASTYDFLVRSVARKTASIWQSHLQRHPQLFLSPEAMGRGLVASAKRASLAGFPGFTMWGFSFPDPDSEACLPAVHKGLRQDSLTMLGKLFEELGRHSRQATAGPLPLFRQKSWIRRLQMIFGEGIGPEVFAPESRGAPFTVIFRRKPCVMVWNLVFRGSRPVGGFIILAPLPENAPELAVNMILRNWKPTSVLPAFLPLTTDFPPTPRVPLVHRALAEPETVAGLESLASLIGLKPAFVDVASGESRISLLAPFLGRLIRLNDNSDQFAFPVALDPLSGYLGVLLVRVPAVRYGFLEGITILLGLVWLVWATRKIRDRVNGKAEPQIGVELELRRILLGVAALPAVLAMGTLIGLRDDIRSNRTESLVRTLQSRLRQLERCDTEIGDRAFRICRKVVLAHDFQHLLKTDVPGSRRS